MSGLYMYTQAPCSRAWGSFVGPVGTTQGAGSVTGVFTYIIWLMVAMVAIPIAVTNANIKNHHLTVFVFTLREKSQVPYQLPTSFLVLSENLCGP